MFQTRRQIARALATAGLFAAVDVRGLAAAPGVPVRMSLGAFMQDRRRIDSLRRGVAAMRARPGSDHRSWFFQAAVHACNDSLLKEAIARDPKVADVDAARYWNKCPHFGQSSANFLIWHRAYLYYFERILRDAAGDPSLALPYWDYSKPENRGFPEIFAPEFLDASKQIANPLYHPNRELAFVTGRYEISAAVGEADVTMAAANFFHEIGVPGLAGDILDEAHTQLGLLEQRPHNDIHIAVGGVIGSNNGAMADVPTAAFDPVFWVHHANIDRLWTEWSASPGKRWGDLPPDEWFDEAQWLFVDVDGSEIRVSRRFYLERGNLPIVYDADVLFGPPLALPRRPYVARTEPPGTQGIVAPQSAMPKMLRESELLADNNPLDLSPFAAATRNLAQEEVAAAATPEFGTERSERPGSPAAGGAAPAPPPPLLASPPAGTRVLLELSDIQFERVPSSGFAVYLDAANGAEALAGLLDLFGATHHHAGMKNVQSFDVTRIVRNSAGPFALRVAPYDLLVSKSGAGATPRSDGVRIGSVRFIAVS